MVGPDRAETERTSVAAVADGWVVSSLCWPVLDTLTIACVQYCSISNWRILGNGIVVRMPMGLSAAGLE